VRQEAEELLNRSRAQAEQITAEAEAEASERRRRCDEELARLEAEAETRRRELHEDTDAVWRRRSELLADIDGMARQLQEAASAAAERFTHDEAAAATTPDPAS
jgi:hypothetical protein